MRFVAIDVETANPDLASICQVGVVSFENGSVVGTWQQLVNPEDYFDPWNVSIHGITETTVKDAPTLPDLFTDLKELLDQQIVVCHTSFDRVALARVLDKYGLQKIDCTWLDSAKVVRRAWPQFASSGYGLANVTAVLGISFQHHVAQEDARAAGEIVLRAITDTDISIQEWLKKVAQPISGVLIQTPGISQEGNPEGSLFGEIAVFTGTLSIPRREAAKLAASVGCFVTDSVCKNTTLLVVGDQDIRRLAGQEKSSKHRKVEDLITKGHPIRILGESDFRRLVGLEASI
jgi:DNA polymerase-3 subunit epsilon